MPVVRPTSLPVLYRFTQAFGEDVALPLRPAVRIGSCPAQGCSQRRTDESTTGLRYDGPTDIDAQGAICHLSVCRTPVGFCMALAA